MLSWISEVAFSIWTFKFSLSDVFAPILNYRFSPIPILATYFVFDSITILRRLTKTAYVPMYFMFFPTGHSDKLYAQYLEEDDFYGEGAHLTQLQKKAIRKRIIRTAVFSMLFAAVAAPYFCGFIAATYLQPQQFNEFLVFLLVVKAFLIIRALRMLRRESMVSWSDSVFRWVLAMYGLYLVFVYYGLTESYDWTFANIGSYSFVGLIIAFFRYLYINLVVGIVFVTLASWAVSDKFMEVANKVRSGLEND